jgi:hypothetical protein
MFMVLGRPPPAENEILCPAGPGFRHRVEKAKYIKPEVFVAEEVVDRSSLMG